MKMDTSNSLTYWWSALLGVFSLLSLQDYVFILGAVISAFFTIKTYYAKRQEEKARLHEETRRTNIIETFLSNADKKPIKDRSAAVGVVVEATKKAAAHAVE
ncbi:hypothetical protein AB8978_09750 [Yersinia enterocolitica]|nr:MULTISPECIES: hypothetical protein [Yersinia]MDA5498018.1 hypothetical protein [Yersinia aleksiciae]NIL00981.1 hypothetical protein [Yersinia aleksiciae]WQC71635.1 hypothetical protein N0K21_03980 [Yersinia aleksiciae]CNE76344.1 putative bacteriophage protein [Yersinia mollaretii]